MNPLGRVRNSFVAGALLVAPLTITVLVLQFVFVRATALLDPVVQATRLATYTGNSGLLAQLLAAVLVAAGITAVGYLASWSVGRRLFGGLERGVRLVPLVRTVYFGVRQVSEALIERAAGYESVVLVEYPREGTYTVGFVTNRGPPPTRSATGEDLRVIFTPNSPNPTGGRLVLVPASDLIELDMSVRRGLQLLVTTGLGGDAVGDELPGAVPDPATPGDRRQGSADGGVADEGSANRGTGAAGTAADRRRDARPGEED